MSRSLVVLIFALLNCCIVICSAQLRCPIDVNCSCHNVFNKGPKLHCPQFTIEVKLESIVITCKTNDPESYNELPQTDFGDMSSNKVHFVDCPLPPDSFQSVFDRLGFTNVNQLLVHLRHSTTNNNTILRSHFTGLAPYMLQVSLDSYDHFHVADDAFENIHEIEELKIAINTKQLSWTIFQNMRILVLSLEKVAGELDIRLLNNQPNMTSLTLRQNNASHMHKEFFRPLQSLSRLTIAEYEVATLDDDVFDLLPQLKYVTFESNHFMWLPSGLFVQLHVLKIQDHRMLTNFTWDILSRVSDEITITGTELKTTPKNTLQLLAQHLDLSDNQLMGSIEIDAPNAEYIDLSHNELTTMPTIRSTNGTLMTLKLNDNHIKIVPESSLQLTPYTKLVVNLSDNNIKSFNPSPFQHVVPNIQFELNNNPFHCDCHLEPLINITKSSIFEQESMKCASPESIVNHRLDLLSITKLECPVIPCPQNCACASQPNNVLVMRCDRASGLQKFLKWEKYVNKNKSNMVFTTIDLHLQNASIRSLPRLRQLKFHHSIRINASNNLITKLVANDLPDNLMAIDVSLNRLAKIPDDVIAKLAHSRSLQVIRLSGNPFQICDCQLKLFVSNNLPRIPDHEKIICEDGRMLMAQETLCGNADLIHAKITIIVVTGVAIAGILLALYFRYQMLIKVFLYAHGWDLGWFDEDDFDTGKIHDAFISYSHRDAAYVEQELVPALENGPVAFRLCLHYRDWLCGAVIQEQIFTSVEQSRRTIIVLSKHFAKSLWGMTEFRAAHHQAMQEGRSRVIIIIHGDIGDIEDLDTELKAYLKTNTYLRSDDSMFLQKLRYSLPHQRRRWCC